MIKAEEIRKINPKEFKYLTKSNNGFIQAWDKRPEIKNYVDKCWKGLLPIRFFSLGHIEVEEFQGKEWYDCLIEFEPDYSDALGCVGFFWDINEENAVPGILIKISSTEDGDCYWCNDRGVYCHFRPAKTDELKFYEE